MLPMPTRFRATAVLTGLSLLQLGGCCSLASLFCGPDSSDWVSVSYATHRDTVTTFLEAVARDNARIICESLTIPYKRRLGIPGCFEAALAWEKLKEQTTGIHLLGDAEVSEPEIESPTRANYRLEIAGNRIDVAVVRLSKIGVRYQRSNSEEPQERYVTALAPHIELIREDFEARVELVIDQLDLPEDIAAEDIVGVFATHTWKIDSLSEPPPES